MNDRLKKQIDFILEIDKMKNLYRQTYVLHEDRKENDAEHSWHLAILAFLLAEYSNEKIDVTHVMKMVLLHDIVEIDAGDTYCYDKEGNRSKAEREEKAAQRIFGLLPDDQRKEFYELWREFENSETADSRFAAVLDRIQPLLLNYTKDGISWKEHGIHKQQVLERNADYFSSSDELSELIKNIIDDAALKQWLKS
ncbi:MULTISPECIES: HD domain-containing protein [Ruminococcus]|uniref:Putative hydrolases of HD superfamily n=1 Tax=Ruminococcus flavefaciens TaxID=1265 RepID=A0A1M7HEA3_RUMFL|nr:MULTISPECIES: HD domain-containing protein [Ruminococcus]MCR4795393.1 HD domain-containing protein [Ruminococcus sp.]SHM26477.1 putative hydrolases of HD superfamily [Ruminococcus flavefaciens]